MPGRTKVGGSSVMSGRGRFTAADGWERGALHAAILEALEQRRLLSCTVVQDGAVLRILGDEGDDVLRVHDSGGGRVAVTCVSADGEGETLSFEGIARIRIDTGAGNDTVQHVAGQAPEGPGGPVVEAAGAREGTFFDLFASLSVDLGRGDDRLGVKYDVRTSPGETERPAAVFDIAAGEGDDDVAIGLLLPAVQKVREAAARARIDLGDGADRLGLSAVAAPASGDEAGTLKGIAALTVKLDAGAGDDAVDASFFDVFADLDSDLGSGNDRHFVKIDFHREPSSGEGPARPDVKLDIAAGAGDDDVAVGMLLPAVQKVREAAARIDLGSGHDVLAFSATGGGGGGGGVGDPTVPPEAAAGHTVKLDLEAGAGRDSADLSFFDVFMDASADLGSGDDSVRLKLSDHTKASDASAGKGGRDALRLDAGAGDDDVAVALLLPAVQKVREAAARLDLGSGDDALSLDVSGAGGGGGGGTEFKQLGVFKAVVDGGAGDDAVDASFFDVFTDVSAGLGAGNDRFQMRNKFEKIEPLPRVDERGNALPDATMDIAAGAGDDQVLIGLLLPAVQKVREAAARAKVDLGEGNDFLGLKLDAELDLVPTFVLGLPPVKVDLDAGAGHDQVAAEFFDVFADLSADLGSGDDRLQARHWIEKYQPPPRVDGEADALPDSAMDIAAGEGDDEVLIGLLLPAVQKVREAAARVRLGEGNDRFTMSAVGTTETGPEGGAAAAGYTVKLRLDAGAGDDEADASFADVAARFVLDGGAGHDRLKTAGRPLKDAFNSVTSVRVLGGAGRDVLTLQLEGILTDPAAAGPPFEALVDGGEGFDVAFVSEGVRVVNVEKVVRA